MKMHLSKKGVLSALLLSLYLAGCGGGGGGGGGAGGQTSTDDKASNSAGTENNAVDAGTQPDSSTITWLPPTENVDSSAFTDLVGYKIYIGSEPGRYKTVRMLEDPGLTEYLIEGLPAGKYYVAMTAVNSQNIESPLSNVVVKVVNDS